MRKLLTILAPGLLLTSLTSTSAAIIQANFSGSVQDQIGTSYNLGDTVGGTFTYNTDTGSFLVFNIDGFSASAPFSSQVTAVPGGASNPYEALYRASTSAAQTPEALNTSFTLDLLSYTNFTTSDTIAILLNPGQLETLANSFDSFYSSFSYYSGTAAAGSER